MENRIFHHSNRPRSMYEWDENRKKKKKFHKNEIQCDECQIALLELYKFFFLLFKLLQLFRFPFFLLYLCQTLGWFNIISLRTNASIIVYTSRKWWVRKLYLFSWQFNGAEISQQKWEKRRKDNALLRCHNNDKRMKRRHTHKKKNYFNFQTKIMLITPISFLSIFLPFPIRSSVLRRELVNLNDELKRVLDRLKSSTECVKEWRERGKETKHKRPTTIWQLLKRSEEEEEENGT